MMIMMKLTGPLLIGLLLAGCPEGAAPPGAAPSEPDDQIVVSGPPSPAEGWRAVTVATGVRNPWGLTWLPDGRPLITSKYGTLHTVRDGNFVQIPMGELPQLYTGGQGGLMDIALHPNFAENGWVYMTMSSGTSSDNRTILVRGRFDGERVGEIETLFRVRHGKTGGGHFGSRILWLKDRTLLMSIGDGGNPPQRVGDRLGREQAQNMGSHHGKVLRLDENGRAPSDNPFVNRESALPEIWSYGHRNIQGIAGDPDSGRLWATEHGPQGGDELNLLQKGGNFGWPEVTLGRDYRTSQPIGADTLAGMIDPKAVWTPAHAPSGLAFYTGDRYPNWRGSLFSGGLAPEDVRRIELDGERVVRQERLSIGDRVRDVRQGPDGYLYLLTDETNGRLIRIEREQ